MHQRVNNASLIMPIF